MNEQIIFIICILGFVLFFNIGLFSTLNKKSRRYQMFGKIITTVKNPWQKNNAQIRELSESVKKLKDNE